MTKNKCANCGQGEVRTQTLRNFETKVRGMQFVVPEARVAICDSCGARFYSPAEIRRWQKLFEAQQETTGKLLSAEEIERMRLDLGLSVSSFALLLGATRQSVYNWERQDRKSPQLRLVDLFLRLIRASATSGAVDVLQFLSEQNGQEVKLDTPSQQCGPPRRPRRRDGRRWWRDPVEYDRAVGTTGPAIRLPGLQRF